MQTLYIFEPHDPRASRVYFSVATTAKEYKRQHNSEGNLYARDPISFVVMQDITLKVAQHNLARLIGAIQMHDPSDHPALAELRALTLEIWPPEEPEEAPR